MRKIIDVLLGTLQALLRSMKRSQPRDSKGRFTKVATTAAPSYICWAVGMDRVVGLETPVAVHATPIVAKTRRPLPSGAWSSFFIWLAVMVAACYKAF